jgi:hypothetical protein
MTQHQTSLRKSIEALEHKIANDARELKIEINRVSMQEAAHAQAVTQKAQTSESNKVPTAWERYLAGQGGQDRHMYETYFYKLKEPGTFLEFGKSANSKTVIYSITLRLVINKGTHESRRA